MRSPHRTNEDIAAASCAASKNASSFTPGRVVELQLEDARVESFLLANPLAHIYHHPLWLKVLEQAFGTTPILLACERDGELEGLLPLAEASGLLSGRLLCSLPHTPVAGPIARNPEATCALLKEAIEMTRRIPGMRLQLRPSRELTPGLGLVRRPALVTFVRELPDDNEPLRFGDGRNHRRISWACNHAAALGVTVREAETRQELCAWYQLYLHTMRWHANPPMPFAFFDAIWELLRPRGFARLLLAEQTVNRQTRLICGSLYLMYGKTVFWAKTGWRREDRQCHPHEVIHIRAIQDASALHYRWYAFGEAEEGKAGQEDFKTKWGSQSTCLFRYYFPTPNDTKGTAADFRGGWMHHFVSPVWRRLPVRGTELAGTFLYRYC